MKSFPLFFALCLVASAALPSGAADAGFKTRNVVLITTDGLRWQEVFTGAEAALVSREAGGVRDTNALKKAYWRDTVEERRAALMPFLWGTVAKRGQIYGNARKGSVARVTNGLKFSYPGYSEFLTGVADPRMDSNAKRPNPNTNVFEWLNQKPAFKGKVAAVVNWDVIPWILNTDRSRLPVWTGFPLPPQTPETIKAAPELSRLAGDMTPLWPDLLLDAITFHAALDYIRAAKPRAFYVAFGETDEWAHEGRYDLYLHAANRVDRFLRVLWETMQAMPQYRDKTTFVITTDHGRGNGAEWKSHGKSTEGAENIWIAVLGPDTPALGERSTVPEVFQRQIAATVAALVGEDFRVAFPQAGSPITEAIGAGRK
jgi:hypothetical protein